MSRTNRLQQDAGARFVLLKAIRPAEALLLLAGVGLVALGSGPARTDAALWALDGAVLALGAVVVLVQLRLEVDGRRFLALGTILTLLIAIPVTRIASAGELIACIGVVIAAVTALARPRPTRRAIWAGLLVIVLGIATAASPDRYALLRFAPFVLAFGSMFLLVGDAAPAVRIRTLRFVLLAAVAEALLAVAEPFVGAPQLWAAAKITAAGVAKTLPNPFLPELVRAQGTLGHPLPLGVLLAVGVALLVKDAIALPGRVRLAAAAPLALGLLASGSRNALLVAALAALVFLPRWRNGRRIAVVAVAVAAVGAIAAVAATPVLRRWAASGSATHRLGALDAVPGLVARQDVLHLLLGNGWASSARMFASGLLQEDGLRAVDDQLVLLLSQGGLVAVALFVVLIVLAIRRATPTMLPVVLVAVASALVFDVLAWPATAALTALAFAPAPLRPLRDPATP